MGGGCRVPRPNNRDSKTSTRHKDVLACFPISQSRRLRLVFGIRLPDLSLDVPNAWVHGCFVTFETQAETVPALPQPMKLAEAE